MKPSLDKFFDLVHPRSTSVADAAAGVGDGDGDGGQLDPPDDVAAIDAKPPRPAIIFTR